MPGEKMHPSLLRVNQHTERVRKELREMTSEMNHFYQRYSGLDEENEFLRESLVLLLNRINDESVSKELSDLGHEIKSKLYGKYVYNDGFDWFPCWCCSSFTKP